MVRATGKAQGQAKTMKHLCLLNIFMERLCHVFVVNFLPVWERVHQPCRLYFRTCQALDVWRNVSKERHASTGSTASEINHKSMRQWIVIRKRNPASPKRENGVGRSWSIRIFRRTYRNYRIFRRTYPNYGICGCLIPKSVALGMLGRKSYKINQK